ncbi:PolC-type DNA polymerase III [Metamycoplasma auris]|uniref:DNA polymerase III PolC-type n=1 Tax=Metamycoplasma auris TaxID=51363 RepID=A0A2W7G659_9BACT|nr:PolC-type DNA polymerase III [Metamycoplasma auris]PZW00555.1 DNA polymerase III catalytic subunit PolC type [Metamycoplasma auris]
MLDKGFENLCKEINFKPSSLFEGTKLLSVQPALASLKNWIFDIQFEEHIEITKYLEFKKAMRSKFPDCKINLYVQNMILDKKVIADYLKYMIDTSYRRLHSISGFINPEILDLNDNQISFNIPTKKAYESFKSFDREIKLCLEKIGFEFLTPLYKLSEKKEINEGKTIVKDLINSFDSIKKDTNNKSLSKDDNNPFFNKSYKASHKPIEMSISDALITFEQIRVMLKGEIFFLEWRTTNTNKRILNIRISDYKEAIAIKYIQDINDEKPNLKIGDTIYVQGLLSDDTYTKSKFILTSGKNWYTPTESLVSITQDNETEKRIDLAVRTNMSAQDGISSPEEYIEAMEKLGHKAIAITDLDNVQSFPSFYNLLKKNKTIKPIYGATLSTISNKNSIFIGYKDFILSDAEYVVFDLETTGLSSRFDDIIEFGASIIKNGKQIEKIQFFLKTNKPLTQKIQELTNINESMLAKGYEQEEGIKKIYEILNNRIAVAHNGSFDMRMCFQKFKELNLDISNLVCIDTLRVSYLLDTDDRLHKLERVCKRFNIAYNVAEAHRADYDANVLAQVWLRMISRLNIEKQIFSSMDLFNYDTSLWAKRRRSSEIRVLAKNQQGLKELFKILSNSLTNDFADGPKFYIEDKDKYPNLLFGSATNQSLLWDKVLFGTDDEIIEEIKNFDYIELPPIDSFVYYVKIEDISMSDLQWAYKDLLTKCKSLNKMCIATSDARYVYEYQKQIHAIYINAPSLGGGKHWLKGRAQPSFKYLTTREMIDQFIFLGDEKIIKDLVINNPKKIVEQIEDIQVIKDKLYVPSFDNSPVKLRELVYKNLYEKYGSNPDKKIIERVEKELNPIIKYGYSAIYWISHKLVKRSNEDGYLVGSRGSVGSSIVANLSQISEVNPLEPHYLCSNCKYFEWSEDSNIYSGWDLPDKRCPKCDQMLSKDGHNIPFETFLGFEANKVPDIDLNFSGEYQPTIHNLVRELFGDDHSFRAGTISKIALKTAFGFCEKYMHEERKDEIPWSRTFLDFLASKAAGVKRTTGQHPGGIIVIPKEFDVEDFTPVNYPANDTNSTWKTTHFNFESIHDNVLKLDLLGHDDPTTIKMLEDLTGVSVKSIPKFDKEVMKLFYTTESMKISPSMIDNETTGAYGLPEFGTNFVRGMLKEAQPRTFNDLILLSGLSHGTNVWAGNAEELVKKGFKLKDCVCCRDDIMQELIKRKIEPLVAFEIMERVRKGKGLTVEQEDLLINSNVPDWYINSLKKIEYMFPKAHATAYVIMAWRIGWYKLYYPLEFYASYFSIRPDAIDIEVMSNGYNKVSEILYDYKNRKNDKANPLSTKESALITTFEITKEMYARGFSIQNVSLEKSDAKNWIVDKDKKSLIPPFNVVDGLGETVAESIIKARAESPFLSIEDLTERAKINIKICNELRRLGILKDLNETNQVELF